MGFGAIYFTDYFGVNNDIMTDLELINIAHFVKHGGNRLTIGVDMGDHRANIKIEITFHGVKDSVDMWINYFPEGCCNVDRRVTEFIEKVYLKGMKKWDEQQASYFEERDKADKERAERAELDRLKHKYESNNEDLPKKEPIK